MTGRKRFYKEVTIAEADGGYAVLLDGKAIRTPARVHLFLPGRKLAEALAEEWRAQGDTIKPETMPLTRLANTAIDRVAPDPAAAVAQILAFGRTDALCYRAAEPAELATRQKQHWDPLLAWAEDRYGARLKVTAGIGYVDQPPDALRALESAVCAYDPFAIAALHAAATVLGSLVVALALADGRLDPEAAFAVAHVDETYQAERWGWDPEAERRRRERLSELLNAERFFRLVLT
jgi:chaperone required for assembly of F1-ATPase